MYDWRAVADLGFPACAANASTRGHVLLPSIRSFSRDPKNAQETVGAWRTRPKYSRHGHMLMAAGKTTNASSVVHLGTVKWFNVCTGYGFITSEDLGDIFVHAQACPEGYLYSGESVAFSVEPSERASGIQVKSVSRKQTSVRSAVVSLGIHSPTFTC